MEQVDLLAGATNLTLFGMGFVFLFLTVLVFVTKLMSIIVNKLNSKAQDERVEPEESLNLKDEIDEETKFVIEQAIKMHRGA